MFGQAVIHIGVEKTGTTSIQKFLSLNMDFLAKRNFLFLDSEFGGSNQFKLATYASLHLPAGTDADAWASTFRRRFHSAIGPLSKRPEAERQSLVFSTEHLHRFVQTQDKTERLRDLLAPYCRAFTIIVYLRRQDHLKLSLASTAARAGSQADLRNLRPFARKKIPKYYNFLNLLDVYAAAFGRDALVVRVFEPGRLKDNDIIADFCDAVGIDDLSGAVIPPRLNESIQLPAQAFMSAINELLPRKGKNNDGAGNAQRLRIWKMLLEHFKGKDIPASRDEARLFMETFNDINEAVRQKYFPDMAGSLFSDSYDAYPEQKPDLDYGFNDAVKISLPLMLSLMAENDALKQKNKKPKRRIKGS